MVALTLREFNRTVMTGGVVSAAAGLLAAVPQMDVAERHTVYKEHLQPSACETVTMYQSSLLLQTHHQEALI